MIAWVPLLGVSAAPLAGPNFWSAFTENPSRCYRDLIVKNTTSGEYLTCGTLISKHQRQQNGIFCYQWVAHVSSSLVLEVEKQGLHTLSAPERSSGVVTACHPCCQEAYPRVPKTDM